MRSKSARGDWYDSKVKLDFRIDYSSQREEALRTAFDIVHGKLGYKIRVSQTEFPDYTLEDVNGSEIKAEAKFQSSSFKNEYEPGNCDLLICWKDDWSDCPIPKLVVSRIAQQRPLFEGFSGGEPPNTRALLRSREALSRMLKSFYYIACDVRDLFFNEYWAGAMTTGLGEDTSIDSIKLDDRYFAEMLRCYRMGWDLSKRALNVCCLRLSADFGDEVFEVLADIGEEVIEKHGASRWGDILGSVRDQGYSVKGKAKGESGTSTTAEIVGSTELLRTIGEGRVSSIAFVKKFKFAEVFMLDPYDLVAKLHGELDWTLNFMQEEQLYIQK